MLSKNFYFPIVPISVYQAFSWKFTEFRVNRSRETANFWSVLKLLFLRTNANSIIILNLSNSSKARLSKRSTTASRAVSDSDFSMFDLSPKINLTPYYQTECSICRYQINFIRLGQISQVRTKFKTHIDSNFKSHDSPSSTKNPKPIKSQDDLFSNHV